MSPVRSVTYVSSRTQTDTSRVSPAEKRP